VCTLPQLSLQFHLRRTQFDAFAHCAESKKAGKKSAAALAAQPSQTQSNTAADAGGNAQPAVNELFAKAQLQVGDLPGHIARDLHEKSRCQNVCFCFAVRPPWSIVHVNAFESIKR